MKITRATDQDTAAGPGDWFHGSVEMTILHRPQAPAQAGAAEVRFSPGARTNWHTHPLGQTLFITAGEGRVQRAGGPVEAVHPGDVIWFEPGERHWHGAAPQTAMTHIAMHEALNGETVTWQEPVSDEDYAASL